MVYGDYDLCFVTNRCALVAEISSDQDPDTVVDALNSGRISGLGPVPFLDVEAIQNSSNIVAQMGVIASDEALERGAQIVVTAGVMTRLCLRLCQSRQGSQRRWLFTWVRSSNVRRSLQPLGVVPTA